MKELLENIEQHGKRIAEYTRSINYLRDSLAIIEAKHQLAIVEAKNEETGKPLYSNDTARAGALKLRLEDNETYQIKLSNLRDLEHERECLRAEIESMRGLFRLSLLDKEEAITAGRVTA
ncbi:MAG: hypothetical protein AB1757_21215 [Acidobacteriota bacterium]